MIRFVKAYRQYVVGDEIDPGEGAAIEYISQGVAERVVEQKPKRKRRFGGKGKK